MDKDTDSNNSSKINISTTSSNTSFATSSNTGNTTSSAVFSNRSLTGTAVCTNTNSVYNSIDGEQLPAQPYLAKANCSSTNLSKLTATTTTTTTQQAVNQSTSPVVSIKSLHKTAQKPVGSSAVTSPLPNMATAGSSASHTTCTTTSKSINLNINTTTGGNFQIDIDPLLNVECLKKIISKKLKVAKDRICLLHREKKLESGSLHDNHLTEGAKIILIPNVETGLLAQRPENTVMQALESLNDCQVNDFLSGKTPLSLSMRLGDHMMLIQLQLSTVNPAGAGSRGVNCHSSRSRPNHHHHHHQRLPTDSGLASAFHSKAYNSMASVSRCNRRHHQQTNNSLATKEANNDVQKREEENTLTTACLGNLKGLARKENPENARTRSQSLAKDVDIDTKNDSIESNSLKSNQLEQSPIKSLSNLVSSPMQTTAISHFEAGKLTGSNGAGAGAVNNENANSSLPVGLPICQDPIAAKLTSCLCTRLGDNTNQASNASVGFTSQEQTLHGSDKSSRLLKMSSPQFALDGNSTNFRTLNLHRITNNSITRKHRNLHHNHNQQRNTIDVRNTACALVTTKTCPQNCPLSNNVKEEKMTDKASKPMDLRDADVLTTTDSQTLAEASRNLTQTLRQLSKQVFTNRIHFSANEEAPRRNCSGAVIESMKNHGKGIYSGTFSGTLNPALQDRYGRPKRDISTVIHILNDLLSATPHYGRGARISLEAPNTAEAKSPEALAHTSRGTKHLYKHQHSQSCTKCSKIRKMGSLSQAMSGADKSKIFACAYSECNGHYVCSRSTLTNLSMDGSITNTFGKYYASNQQAVSRSNCCQQEQTAGNDRKQCSAPVTPAPTAGLRAASKQAAYHHHQRHSHHDGQIVNDRKVCQCRYRVHGDSVEREHICIKCSNEIDNIKTKSKLDHLRLVMQQRKQKREARRLKTAPYQPTSTTTQVSTLTSAAIGTAVSATSDILTASSNSTDVLSSANTASNAPISVAATTTTPASEVSPNHMVEEVDTAA